MAVGSFDPQSLGRTTSIKAPDLAEFIAAAQQLEAGDINLLAGGELADAAGLSELSVARLGPLAQHAPNKGGADWSEAAQECADGDLVALIRLFTLAESRLAGWEAGAKSPVVPLAALLRKRGTYPAELTSWIKSNTQNRFLPYGNLMDRL